MAPNGSVIPVLQMKASELIQSHTESERPQEIARLVSSKIAIFHHLARTVSGSDLSPP